MKNLLENWNKYLQNINEISPSWRTKERNFDEETPFGHYGALKDKQPASDKQQEKNDKFVKYAAQQFDRIFNTNGFYSKQLSTPEQRKECGFKGHEFVTGDDAMMSARHMCQLFIDHMETAFEKWTPRKKYEVYKV